MPSGDRRVLITGLGAVSAFGRGVGPFWEAALAGRQSDGQLRAYSPPANLDPAAREALDRASLIASDAAIQAVEDASLPFTAQTTPLIGVVYGSEKAAAAAMAVARVLGVAGPVLGLTGAGSGLAAVAEGFELVKRGAAPVVVVGGADVISGSTQRPPPRPFDAAHAGSLPAEGAFAVVLEDSEIAEGRGARSYAEVLGGGLAFSRATVMRPGPNFVDAARAMRAALLRAEVFQGEVEAVFASANGDPDLDETEARALADLWGPNVDRLTVTSVLGSLGHPGAGAGPASLVAAAKALEEGRVPPVAGCERPAEAFSVLDIVVGEARVWRFNTAIVNDFSAGTNGSLLLRRQG